MKEVFLDILILELHYIRVSSPTFTVTLRLTPSIHISYIPSYLPFTFNSIVFMFLHLEFQVNGASALCTSENLSDALMKKDISKISLGLVIMTVGKLLNYIIIDIHIYMHTY